MIFLIDMPLSSMLARWLSDNGHDAIHAAAVALDRASDSEILLRAKDEARIVVTAALDYPRLLAISASIEPSLVLFVAATGQTRKFWPAWQRCWTC